MLLRIVSTFFVLLTSVSSFAQGFQYQVFDTDLTSSSVYRERRARLLDSLPDSSIAIIQSAEERNRQNDVDYEYRQNSNLLYLTGYPHPGATLFLMPSGIQLGKRRVREILFVSERNPEREQWVGLIAGPEESMKVFGIDTALKSSMLQQILNVLLEKDSASDQSKPGGDEAQTFDSTSRKVKTLYLDSWPTRRVGMTLLGKNLYVDTEVRKGLAQRFPGLEVTTGIDALVSMREVKDEEELRLMRKAIDISVEGHLHAIRNARAGMHEFEIEALTEFMFKYYGAEDVGYPSIVGSGYNACILHYNSNRRMSLAGDMILSDCGAEYHGYTADITRTFPLNGIFTSEQKIIYNIVLEAQDSGIAACRAGAPFRASHAAAKSVIKRRLMEEKIISDTAEVGKYFMHGTSHYLGLDVHDVGTRGPLKPNTVLTVEPGVYIAEGSPCDKRWWNIGVRIEDDVLVTKGEPDLLSKALPRTVDDLEKIIGIDAKK